MTASRWVLSFCLSACWWTTRSSRSSRLSSRWRKAGIASRQRRYAWSHTAAPMLAGTLVTVIGLMPIGFAHSGVGEYCGNLFWVVCFALLASWVVAVTFTPYLGVKLLPNIPRMEGGYAAIYETPKLSAISQTDCLVRRAQVSGRRRRRHRLLRSGLWNGLRQATVLSDLRQAGGADRHHATAGFQHRNDPSYSNRRSKTGCARSPKPRLSAPILAGGAPRFWLAYNPDLPGSKLRQNDGDDA